MSTEDDAEVVRDILPRPTSRPKIIVDESDDVYPKRRKSLSSVRYVRSHSPRRAHFVDKLDNSRSPRRRSSSISRVSFVDEPEEVIVSRPRSRSRRPRVYYDGAGSGQSEAKQILLASERLAGSEDGIQERVRMYRDPSISVQLHPISIPSSGHSSFYSRKEKNDVRSSSSAGREHSSRALDEAGDESEVMPQSMSDRSLRPATVESFIYDDFKGGPLWKQTNTDSARHISLAENGKPSKNRATGSIAPPPKRRCFRQPSSYASSESQGERATLRKSDYRHVPARSLEVPLSTTVHRVKVQSPIPLTPDHPNHPDHLAYLLSAQHITPVETAPGEWEYYQNRSSPLSADYSPPTTPTDTAAPYYRHAYSGGDGYEYSKYQPRSSFEVDYEGAEDREAKGRHYIELMAPKKAAREHLEYAYA